MLLKYKYVQFKKLLKRILPKSNYFDPFIDRPLVYYSTPIGNYYLPADAPYDNIASLMRNGKIFEPEIVELAKQYIKKDSIVLDIGANFGQMSLLFSQMVGNNGKVYAFEANNYVFNILTENIKANHANNIRTYHRAVYNRLDEILIFPEPDFIKYKAYGSYGLNPNAKLGEKVRTITIDSIDFELPVSFMKIDVQGADLMAMQGAIETIKKYQMPLLFEYEEQFQEMFNTDFNDYVDFVYSIGYKFVKTIDKINFLAIPDEKKQYNIKNIGTSLIEKKEKRDLCKFLQTTEEIHQCTAIMYENGYVSHDLICKNWDLAHIIPEIKDGRFLDMGSSDSFILKNLSLIGFVGELHGIDLRSPNVPVNNVNYSIGDLMDTKYPDNHFRYISCLSVIEHEVDFEKFAAEVSRILEPNGKLFLTFDYWNPKIKTDIELFGLKWNILDKNDVELLINVLKKNNLVTVTDIDWNLGKPVINQMYGSPDKGYKYTFGMLVLTKQT